MNSERILTYRHPSHIYLIEKFTNKRKRTLESQKAFDVLGIPPEAFTLTKALNVFGITYDQYVYFINHDYDRNSNQLFKKKYAKSQKALKILGVTEGMVVRRKAMKVLE